MDQQKTDNQGEEKEIRKSEQSEAARIAMSVFLAFLLNTPLQFWFYLAIGFSYLSDPILILKDSPYLFIFVILFNILIAFIISRRHHEQIRAFIIIFLVNLVPYFFTFLHFV